MSSKAVSRDFQGSSKDVLRKFQGSLKKVWNVFQEKFKQSVKWLLRMFLWSFVLQFSLLHGSHRSYPSKMRPCFLSILTFGLKKKWSEIMELDIYSFFLASMNHDNIVSVLFFLIIASIVSISSIATLGSILDSQLSWKSSKFQLSRWSHKVVVLSV